MFIKLLTLITALFVGGGVNSPPTLHKQKQTNTIKETYVQRGWELYNIFNPYLNISDYGDFTYTINEDDSITLTNFTTFGEIYLTTELNLENGHNYFFNWQVLGPNGVVNPFGVILQDYFGNEHTTSFTEIYNASNNNRPLYNLNFVDSDISPNAILTFYFNVIDLTTNSIPYFDTMIELWTDKEVEDEVNVGIENTKNTNYPLYSMKFNYIVNVNDITQDIPLTFRGDDYTHIYKSDLYSAINSRVGNVANNFTIKIWLPIKNMRDLSIYVKGNNIKLLTIDNEVVYSYTQGNNIFSLDLPQSNEEFSYIELSFYDFNSIGANDVILSVSNSVDYNSYQNGYDEGKKVGYEEGSKDGYLEGKENGIQQGEEIGFDKGYDKGLSDGALNKGFNPFTMVSTAFESVSKLLSVNIFGGITIATLVSIPFIFLVVLFILKLIKG